MFFEEVRILLEQNQLYPVFELPVAYGTYEEKQRTYAPAPMFDYDRGDFVRDGANRVVMADGKEAYREWCMKVLLTQQGACVAYVNAGIRGEQASAATHRQAIQTEYVRAITEALKRHPNTDAVKDFSFQWAGDEMRIQFTVQGKNIAAFDIALNVTP